MIFLPFTRIWSGSRVTSPLPGPLRAGLASRPASRLKQLTYPKRRAVAMNLAMTVIVYKSQIIEFVHAPELLGNHMMKVQFLAIFEMLVTDRTTTTLS